MALMVVSANAQRRSFTRSSTVPAYRPACTLPTLGPMTGSSPHPRSTSAAFSTSFIDLKYDGDMSATRSPAFRYCGRTHFSTRGFLSGSCVWNETSTQKTATSNNGRVHFFNILFVIIIIKFFQYHRPSATEVKANAKIHIFSKPIRKKAKETIPHASDPIYSNDSSSTLQPLIPA